MEAVEVTGNIDAQGNLRLDQPLLGMSDSRVRVLIMSADREEADVEDMPVEQIKASLKEALQQAKAGQRIPLSQMWDEMDNED
jgi:hypothetical protein